MWNILRKSDSWLVPNKSRKNGTAREIVKERNGRNHFHTIAFAAGFFSLFSSGFSHAQANDSSSRGKQPFPSAYIGFAASANDAEILMLLGRYNVAPQAAYMGTSGLTGIHRTYAKKSARAFLDDARAKSVESFTKSIDGNRLRLQRFTEQYTEQEVVASEDLQVQARSLLNIRASLESALSDAETDKPVIYSLEVTGEASQIEQLSKDQMVTVFQAEAMAEKIVIPHPPKPEVHQRQRTDPSVQAMGATDLYRQIQFLSGTGAK